MGRPAKRTPLSSPGRVTWNEGVRCGPPAASVTVMRDEASAMSFSSARISADAGVSSSEATISTGCVMRSR